MINLLKVHYQFLYTKWMKWITIVLIVLWLLLCIYISGASNGIMTLTYEKRYYQEMYMFDGTTFLKLFLLIFILFNSLYTQVFNSYDVILCNIEEKYKVLLSKLFVMTLYNILFASILVLIFTNIWAVLPYSISFATVLSLLLYTISYTTYVTIFQTIMYMIFQHMLILLVPFIIGFISIFSIDYGTLQSDFSRTQILIQILHPDLIYFEDTFQIGLGIVPLLTNLIIITYISIKIYRKYDMII